MLRFRSVHGTSQVNHGIQNSKPCHQLTRNVERNVLEFTSAFLQKSYGSFISITSDSFYKREPCLSCSYRYDCILYSSFSIFGHEGSQADDIIYINWLNMVRAGLLALEFYTPDTCKWGQVGKTFKSIKYT